MQKIKKIISYTSLFAFFIMLSLTSCEDETSKIGPSISPGEVTISVDSIIYKLSATSQESDTFNSKTGNLLIGNLDVPEYGNLTCSFVTRFMPAPNLSVPDSLFSPERVDSCKFIMTINKNGLTGDSVAPQKLSVFKLDKQLPSDIDNLFNPEGYYNPSAPLGSKSFILSGIADSTTYFKSKYVSVQVPLDVEFGKQIFEKYKSDPSIFQWPQSLTSFLPGFYVKQTFGKGCVANVAEAFVAVYYYYNQEKITISGNDTTVSVVHKRDSVLPLIVSPEVLSSNNVRYEIAQSIKQRIADGENIITTPSGYYTKIKFPAKELIEKFENSGNHLSTINELTLTIPGEPVENSIGIETAPNLLLIKASEKDEFFAKNKIPDGISSFVAIYDSGKKNYQFASIRNYLINLLKKDEITDDDEDFFIIPVDISYETVNNYYSTSTYVTKCVPYTLKPTVTKLNTDEALIIFSFSSQFID